MWSLLGGFWKIWNYLDKSCNYHWHRSLPFFPVLNSDMIPGAVEHFVTMRKAKRIATLPARRLLNRWPNTGNHLPPDFLLYKKNNPHFVWLLYFTCSWCISNWHRKIINLYLDVLSFRSDGKSRWTSPRADGNMIGILERGLVCKFKMKIYQQMVVIETNGLQTFTHIPPNRIMKKYILFMKKYILLCTFPSIFYCEYFQAYRNFEIIEQWTPYTHHLDSAINSLF